jgi:hypothetical protein
MSTLLRLVAGLGVASLLIAIDAGRAGAMGMEGFGPAGKEIGRSPDWPKGVEDVLRHEARVYWYDVNGSESAFYDGDIATVNELLELYSQVDVTRPLVIIRPGRPSAKSFEGKQTPYVVEFEVPGGIVLSHLQKFANTGLYTLTPQLVMHIDAGLAEHLSELKIPENVTVAEAAVRVEDALAFADDEDVGLRYRAIVALGDALDPTSAGLAALLRASRDENVSIRTAGSEALVKIAAAKEPAEQSLRQRLSEFVRTHPQYAQAITPETLLKALRDEDAEFAKGFTARGTLVKPTASGRGKLVAWTVTMGDGKLVLEQRDVEDADHAPEPGRFEYTIYTGPERMASIHGYHTWVDGKLSEMKPQASFEPVGSTYDLLIGRMLWPLGRGFSRRIDRVTSVATAADGMLTVSAESDDGSLMSRWELQVDPGEDFLVRSAKGFRREEAEPSYVVDAAGVLTGGGRSTAHTSRWMEGAAAPPVSFAVTSVSATTDAELIRRTESRLDTLPDLRR